ncbi:gamma DNA-directed DNA polymerase [Rhodocollybia butyracea]|uniref:Mitochondrial DNA polymerase catalytic subunit n=1 Tax=Rhodocollybia butyracea TaxID=206335 RepID=A0A9P5UGR0_9AGAR|nr:gamma DNA-directed DNA polymerase [Rhodocollybia butyracea]
MLKLTTRIRNSCLSRGFHATRALEIQTFKPRPPVVQPTAFRYKEEKTVQEKAKAQKESNKHAKRNAAGVQMLSRSLHEQIFRNCTFPSPPNTYTNISLDHLSMHGLDPTQSSTLPSTEFVLPSLQGNNLLEHFHRIGVSSSEPYISFARDFAQAELPPIPDDWQLQPGWTKYHHSADGSGYCEPIPFPAHDGKTESLLTFDVETMPKYHQYPILACAASPNAWYVWISPWILDPSSNSSDHLIPLGPSDVPRIVVGHNVSYDRARIQEEYHLNGTKTRFLDTMSLHVAIKGISSHQRPAWAKYRKEKQDAIDSKDEAIEAVIHLLRDVEQQLDTLRQEIASGHVDDKGEVQKLVDLQTNLEESLSGLQTTQSEALSSSDSQIDSSLADALLDDDEISLETSQKRWEDITSGNSLLDVAKLHCNIDISKEIRSDFMTSTPSQILEDIHDYITYCATDVSTTHAVYKKVLPEFLVACPHPVSFAGVTTMGSGFLPVNEQWEAYIDRAERVWQTMEGKVRLGLENLARAAVKDYRVSSLDIPVAGSWQDDVWLSQLDWSPKVAGKTRGIYPPGETPMDPATSEAPEEMVPSSDSLPSWYATVLADPLSRKCIERILPLLLELSFEHHPLRFTPKEKWHYLTSDDPSDVTLLPTAMKKGLKTGSVLSRPHSLLLLQDGSMTSCHVDLALQLSRGENDDDIKRAVLQIAESASRKDEAAILEDPWLRQLDWSLVEVDQDGAPKPKAKKTKVEKPPPVYWPKWYWDLTKPKKGMPPGSLDITIRNRFSPLLLKMSWQGFPLFYSREHGWVFRAPSSDSELSPEAREKLKRFKVLSFYDPDDEHLAKAKEYQFHKLPHKDGESANVGSPLAKSFLKFAMDGVLQSSAGDELKELVDVGSKCSYWISARDRILNQMVKWEDQTHSMGFPPNSTTQTAEELENQQKELVEIAGALAEDFVETPRPKKWGIIVPQVITMGTVTRRAIEKTWLTASNAKKNRVGSELKAMVRAPPGYAIVGADVDSEELWISSCMGDAQFGMHGATAIGWMTLEGTKSAGTDLHSKTASILGISRDQAKVFNYSRIYGAGMRHAMLLLQQGNSNMTQEEAQKLAESLYASTKGKNTHRNDIFDRKFWYGGTESYLFNKLEEIALSEKPQTPALGCGVTHALQKDCLPAGFGSDYMPSRINWVVQSSGVDYLHLLIVSMDHLIRKYDIGARYLISVHDELRYLVKEEDRFRAALALQIANLWTRCMFAYKLGLDDLPQGVAFFSAVDVDKVLRKEVDMPCVTPSQPIAIPPGETLGIGDVLTRTNGGSLWADGRAMDPSSNLTPSWQGNLDGFVQPDCLVHRAHSAAFLRAQATSDFSEVKHLARQVQGKKFEGRPGSRSGSSKFSKRKKSAPVGNGEDVDWSGVVERLMSNARDLRL